LGNPNTVIKNKKMLMERDIIEMTDDERLAIVDPVMKLWLRRQ